MSYYLAVPLLLLVALLEVTVLPYFRIAGVQPDLMLIVLLSWLMVRGLQEALFLIPLGGLFLGLVDGAPLGTAVLALTPIAFLHELRGSHLSEGQFGLTLLFMVIASFAFSLVHLGVYALFGQFGGAPADLAGVLVLSALVNVFFLVPVYGLLWVASADVRRPAFA